MVEIPLGALVVLAAAIGLGIPAYAGRVRGRPYAIFSAVLLAIALPPAVWLLARLEAQAGPWVGWAGLYGLLALGVHMASLVRARLRPRAFRYGVSVPGQAFMALGALAGPWLLALSVVGLALGAAGAHGLASWLSWLDWAPVALVAFSLGTSLRLPLEFVRVHLAEQPGPAEARALVRLPLERQRRAPAPLVSRPLRVVQIADPHLGPWQPVHRLRRRLERLLAQDPDLVLLTGDYLTMEGNGTPGALAQALAPLRALPGRCVAIFGNHDHEAPEEVRSALESCGARLLVDKELCLETAAGPVQIVGADWYRQERKEKLLALLQACPRREGHLRLLLLHDPLGFRDVPPGDVDLTLSGHTHGGQVGLVSFGLDWTVLSRSRWPDHGLFGHAGNRLYVHRGTGFYGFPLRIGVPGEASVVEIVQGAGTAAPRSPDGRSQSSGS